MVFTEATQVGCSELITQCAACVGVNTPLGGRSENKAGYSQEQASKSSECMEQCSINLLTCCQNHSGVLHEGVGVGVGGGGGGVGVRVFPQ